MILKIIVEQIPDFGCIFLPVPLVWNPIESGRLLTCPPGNLVEAS